MYALYTRASCASSRGFEMPTWNGCRGPPASRLRFCSSSPRPSFVRVTRVVRFRPRTYGVVLTKPRSRRRSRSRAGRVGVRGLGSRRSLAGTTRKAPTVASTRTSSPDTRYSLPLARTRSRLEPRGSSRSRVNTSRGSPERLIDSTSADPPTRPRPGSGRSRSIERGSTSLHMLNLPRYFRYDRRSSSAASSVASCLSR